LFPALVFADVDTKDGVSITENTDLDGFTSTIDTYDGQTVSAAGYHADTSFVWECDNTTAEYANTGGDTSATAVGGDEAISGGACVFNDTSANGNDYYYFTVGSGTFPEIDDEVGTVFIRFKVTTWVNESYLWNPWADANDNIYIKLANNDDLMARHQANGASDFVTLTGNAVSTGTEYILRYRWDVSRTVQDQQLTLYNTSMTELDDIGPSNTIDAFTDQLGTDAHYIGQDTATSGSNFSLYYIHVFKTWRDTDPNA
jgi:hypothetical protein